VRSGDGGVQVALARRPLGQREKCVDLSLASMLESAERRKHEGGWKPAWQLDRIPIIHRSRPLPPRREHPAPPDTGRIPATPAGWDLLAPDPHVRIQDPEAGSNLILFCDLAGHSPQPGTSST